jgi:ABC-2 type transport system permease protein
MLRNLFLKELRDQRWSLLLWSVALIGYVVIMCAVYPTVAENQQSLEQLIKSMPPAFKNYILGQAGDFFTPAGYLGARIFALLSPLVLLIFAVGGGSRTVAGEEDAGTLGLLLAHPLSRRRALTEKYLSLLAAVSVINAAHLVGLLLGVSAVGVDADLSRVLQASVSLWLLCVMGASLAFAAGSLGGRRGTATAAAAGVLLLAYLLDTIGLLVSSLGWLRELSFFYYYEGGQVMQHGLTASHLAVLLVTIAVCLAASYAAFLRRSIRE